MRISYFPVKKKKLYYGDTIPSDTQPEYQVGDYSPVPQLPPQTPPSGYIPPQNKTNYGNTASSIIGLGQTAGKFLSSFGETPSGRVNVGLKVGGGALSGAATGASLGSFAGPIGTAVGAIGGAIIGGVTSGIQAGKRNSDIMIANREQKKREEERQDEYSKTILNMYPTTGIKSAQYYYKYGGKLYLAQGGTIHPIASDVAVAQGATHEQGGIDVGSAEVEDQEVLAQQPDGSTDVFSDRLRYRGNITFAQAAQSIATRKAAEEQALQSTSIFRQGTARRNIQKLDIELKQLFEAQEVVKKQEGRENPVGEAGFGDTIGAIMPYLDNATNAYLTMATPQIPKPIYNKAVPLKTTYNIEPQLAETRNQTRQLEQSLARNTSNSSTLRNNVIAANTAVVEKTNQLYGVKENAETQLKNADAINRQEVINSNIGMENNYNMNKMNRIDDIHQRISTNVADASMNYQQQQAEYNMKQRDLLELQILKAQYIESGVFDRNLQDAFDKYEKGDMRYEEVMQKLKQSQLLKRKQKTTPVTNNYPNGYGNGVPSLSQIAPISQRFSGNNSNYYLPNLPYRQPYNYPVLPR